MPPSTRSVGMRNYRVGSRERPLIWRILLSSYEVTIRGRPHSPRCEPPESAGSLTQIRRECRRLRVRGKYLQAHRERHHEFALAVPTSKTDANTTGHVVQEALG